MKVSRFIFNMFGVNTYVLWDPESHEAAIVDPGMVDRREEDALFNFINLNSLNPTHLIDTHMHLDHIFGNLKVKEKYGLHIKAHPDDDFLGRSLSDSVNRFRLPIDVTDHGLDIAINDGDTIYLGKEPIKVISVPGHSPGSVALYCPQSGFVLTGDALFQGSIGRTDLPGGDHATLIDSIRTRLLSLPPETVVLPGHGGETSIVNETTSNPYI